jgi:simple sugar transport system permease protein
VTGARGQLWRLLGFAAAAFVIMTIATRGVLLTASNLESMAFQFPELALLSLAMMLAMLSGGIDLSIVSVANLSGIAAALTMTRVSAAHGGWPAAAIFGAGLAAALGCGLACGALNGVLIGVVGVPPILATLGTMEVFFGGALAWTHGQAVVGLPDWLQLVGNGSFAGAPIPLWVFLAAACVVAVLSSWTVFGIESRLVGANPLASWFSAIPVRSVLIRTYVASAGIASVTGVLMVARANSAKADYGTSYLLQSILVVVLGGVNPAGGTGRVFGVGVAVIALQALGSGFGLLHFSSFARELAWGAFLLVVMVANWWFDREQ